VFNNAGDTAVAKPKLTKAQRDKYLRSKREARALVEEQVQEGALPRAAYTIPEFCAAHRISETHYYKLRRAGRGPIECRMLGKIAISLEAAKAWLREQEQQLERV
jgi:hypothetical protein